ncbi:MAG: permease [Thermodesulfobacteriota bacterium]
MTNSTMGKKRYKQTPPRPSFFKILQKNSLAILAIAPLLMGVIGLVGLFQVLVTPKTLSNLFQGNPIIDTMVGTLTGAVASGNPVISYLIGGELLGQGISLYAISALVLSWVTLSFIHLPAEVEVFGGRFTLYRNILAFCFTIITAILTTLTLSVLL